MSRRIFMRKQILHLFTLAVASVAILAANTTFGQYTPSRTSNRQIQTLLARIETKTDSFKREMDYALDRSPINSTNTEDRYNDFISEFEQSTDALRSGFNSRQNVSSEVSEVLNRAAFINRFMTRNRLTTRAQSQWSSLRTDLNTLATYYRLSWNWNRQIPVNNSSVLAYNVSDNQLRSLLANIETKTDVYKTQMDRALDRSRLNNTNGEDNINSYISNFENATDRLKEKFDDRKSVGADATEVLTRAQFIDRFMASNRLTTAAQAQWRNLKTDLNTLATYYRVSWNLNEQSPANNPSVLAYTVSDNQLRSLLANIETKTDLYKTQMDRALDRSSLNNTNGEDNINSYISNFENATDRLKHKFDDRQSLGADASEVLTRAQFIDRFMASNRLTTAAQAQWRNLKADLNTLASYYRVSWNVNETVPTYPGNGGYPAFDSRITGTYRLNTSLSDDVHGEIDKVMPHYNTQQHDSVQLNLQRRLASPEMIAIDKNNRTISLASTNSPQVTFEADGVAKTETNARGRTVTTTATTTNNGFEISYVGERANDFNVTFAPTGNGQLKVTRRIYLDDQDEQITVSSVYDKVSNTAQWTTVNTGAFGNINTGSINDFYIPNGVKLTAVLNNSVDTKVSQPGDRFTLQVTSPSQYRDAVIEGHIGSAASSGRVSGRANVSMEFDTIRLQNGQSYRFAGIIDSVRAANGDNVSVNNEGAIRDSSQTTKTVTRAGIGAVLGAIIGAVAGGGSGAAIGAGVGAGAGAGSVLITGRDSIELAQGSEFTISTSAPASVGVNR